jgi:hypothetical protein
MKTADRAAVDGHLGGPVCSNVLETGDPVVGLGFTEEANTFRQGRRRTAPRWRTASTTRRRRLCGRGSCG